MGTICKKCNYERQPSDQAPDYECPRCGAVYAKVEAYLRALEAGEEPLTPEVLKSNGKKKSATDTTETPYDKTGCIMKQYVGNEQANAQVHQIAWLIGTGKTDEQVAEYLVRNKVINLAYAESYWTPDDIRELRLRYRLASSGMQLCPKCSAEIKAEATKCRHCQTILSASKPSVNVEKTSGFAADGSLKPEAINADDHAQYAAKKPTRYVIAKTVSIVIILMLLFPPFYGKPVGGVEGNLGYWPVLAPPEFYTNNSGVVQGCDSFYHECSIGSVNILQLTMQIIVVLVLGGIAFLVSKKE